MTHKTMARVPRDFQRRVLAPHRGPGHLAVGQSSEVV
jgi:hypothetical protein